MAKLNKRQIIILVIAALFILYAAYEYLIAGPAAKKAKAVANPAHINTFVSDLHGDLIKDIVAGVDSYIIVMAEDDWKRNPFWERSSYKEWAAREGGAGTSSKIIKIPTDHYLSVR